MHNAIKWPTKQQTFAITIKTLFSEDKWQLLLKQHYPSASSTKRSQLQKTASKLKPSLPYLAAIE